MTSPLKHVERYRYDADSLIGDGGFAAIYRAREQESNSDVALKILKPEFETDTRLIESFFRDAQTTRGLAHPNIIRIMNLGTAEAAPYFVAMEYCECGDLKKQIQRRRRLPMPDALRYAVGLCEALEYCHGMKIFHRDIKASNVLFRDASTPVLSDFSDAMNSVHPDDSEGVPRHLGSPPYMSPEAWGTEQYTVESELYSLGILLYYMFTGVMPFLGESPEEFRRMHLYALPTSPSAWRAGITPPLAQVVHALLEKRPQDRFHSAEEVKRSLEDIYRQSYEGVEGSERPSVVVSLNGKTKSAMTVRNFPFRVGKGDGEKGLRNDLVLRNEDPYISRLHAIIERFEDGFAFIDVSTNGSTVNGMRIHKQSVELLRDNTVIIGKDTKLGIRIVHLPRQEGDTARLPHLLDLLMQYFHRQRVRNGAMAVGLLVMTFVLIRFMFW